MAGHHPPRLTTAIMFSDGHCPVPTRVHRATHVQTRTRYGHRGVTSVVPSVFKACQVRGAIQQTVLNTVDQDMSRAAVCQKYLVRPTALTGCHACQPSASTYIVTHKLYNDIGCKNG